MSSPSDFIRDIVEADRAAGKHSGRVATRFPPEPNGYLHIGHAKSICLNFGIAQEFGGACHLRYDDTNPTTEDPEFVDSIQDDVRWLGFDWGSNLFFASDYFERLYELALGLVRNGKAYVCSLSEEEIREYRGTVTEAGRESPYRGRSIDENLALFQRMRAGELADGSHVLRAKIDMASPNMKMRDPLLYRIRHAAHYRTGDAWPIYPMYDFAHPLSDAFEGITHSLCTLEFENNRELYDWVVRETDVEHTPRQIEFARLNLSYTVLSKRKLAELVEGGHVEGWSDPRMPTLSGLRRRGYTPSAIRRFCESIGVAKANATIDVALLEHTVRDDLNREAPRVLCVLHPLKVVIENYPEGGCESLDASFFPHDVPENSSRPLPFGRELYIERDDFLEQPPKGFYRLAPGREVRLRHAYVIRCEKVIHGADGEPRELRCTYDPASLDPAVTSDRKVKGTIHWVSAADALDVEVRLYDRLFRHERPDQGKDGPDFKTSLNDASLEVLSGCKLEPSIAGAELGSRFQFERQGYFYLEPEGSSPGRLAFNRIVALRDSWAKQGSEAASAAASKAVPEHLAKTTKAAEAKRRRRRSRGGEEPQPLTGAAGARFERYLGELGLSEHEARVLAESAELAAFFEAALGSSKNAKSLANWIVHELLRELKGSSLDALPFSPAELAELVELIEGGTLAAAGGKEVLAEMVASGGRAAEIVEKRGLTQLGDAGEVGEVIDAILAREAENAALYRGGKTALFGYFIGQVMKETGGRADPKLTRELLKERLAAG